MIAYDEEAAAGAIIARPPGADEVRTACDRPGRKAASTAPRGVARTCSRAAAGRPASDAATTLPSGVDLAPRPTAWAATWGCPYDGTP
jgi:hypothetical protein